MESLYEEVKSDGNICVHTKAESITIFKQFYYKIYLVRILNLLKNAIKISVLFSSFATKIFWLKAKIFNVSNTAVIEKIKRVARFGLNKINISTNEITIEKISRISSSVFKEVNIKNVISDLKMLIFYNFSKNYNIDIIPSFKIENILLKRKVNTYTIKEGTVTVEAVELEVKNNTPDVPDAPEES